MDWFLDAVWVRYGYDFRQYARASLIRRVHYRLQSEGLKRVSELIPLVLYDEDFFQRFLKDMSVTVTTMFRNAVVFKGIRDQIVSFLRTYPRINIWHAGCATGEEVYSMAILLKEEGLLERTRIYATDYNNQSLEFAKHGIYPLKEIRGYTENYLCAGGKGSFSDYYQARYEHAIMNSDLKDRITFAHHNLMKDGVFAEMHLVLCRNVLIYFDQNLQNRVLKVLSNSLVHRGFLVLGDKETLDFSAIANEFDEQVDRQRIYRKRPVLNSIT
ncbi:chemotaxis protein CheR [Gammaproteobacteria bacterium 45_16_T64]|nr:chemotaxis protein CheR [Gammaproteobacteria bacterium 45_16_T64]